ncbi:serine/threonine protein kinase [bacterium 1xD8-6]|jgi:Protein kinase domain.|nr:serine/threonine protein kinase [bacterium D16-36]RKI61104.1 serine/threonine protein kinase [bacterium 1xD8-6]
MKNIEIGTEVTDINGEIYVIKERIGTGGFAIVYRAEKSNDKLDYAIKVAIGDDESILKSMKNEYEAAGKIRSLHSIEYFYFNEYGDNDFPCFIIMEYADGGTLESKYKERQNLGQPYTNDELKEIYMQLIEGMMEIGGSLVHRDIKLANILIKEGILKISDYGISKDADAETRSNSKTMKGYGSIQYYAPELLRNPNEHGLNNTKVDIYAMGIVFYELANLRYPYSPIEGRISDYRSMHLFAPVEVFRTEIDASLQEMILKMIARKTTERFNSWIEIRDFLAKQQLNKKTGNEFVENLVKDHAKRKQIEEAKKAEKNRLKAEHEEFFKLLKMEIEEQIYKPLLNVVRKYNDSILSDGMILQKMKYNMEEETISFKFVNKVQKEECEDRSIDFDFWLVHDTEDNRGKRKVIDNSIGLYNDYEDIPVSYHYYNKKILLWGTVRADCGAGISIAITESKEDPNYGDLMCVTKIKNDGSAKSYAISESDLRKYCRGNFRDIYYTIKFSDFDFECIEQLIKMNSVFQVNSFYEPTSIDLW